MSDYVELCNMNIKSGKTINAVFRMPIKKPTSGIKKQTLYKLWTKYDRRINFLRKIFYGISLDFYYNKDILNESGGFTKWRKKSCQLY